MRIFFRLLGLFLALQLATSSVGQALKTSYFVDSTSTLSFSNLLEVELSRFQPGISFAGKCPTWVRVEIPKSTRPGTYCIDHGVQTSVEAFWFYGGTVHRAINGSFVPPSKRSQPRHSRSICFEVDSSTHFIFIKFPPDDIRVASAPEWEIVPERELTKQLDTWENESYMITGGMVVFALMSLAIFLYLRDRTFLLFGIYLIAMYTMVNTAFLQYHLGELLPSIFLSRYVNQIFFITTPFVFTWFSYEYFLIKDERIYWRYVFWALFGGAAVCLVTLLSSYGINTLVILLYNFLVIFVVFIYSIVRYLRDRSPSMLYFLSGLIFPVIAAMLILLHSLVIVTVSSLRQIAGTATLLFCLAMGVGMVDRYRRSKRLQIQKEQEAALLTVRSEALEHQNRLIEQQRVEMENQARKYSDLNETKDKLLSVLSHDLRGPVGNLGAILDLLSSNTLTHQEFHDLSNRLRTDVRSTHGMLEEVLQWVGSQRDGIVPKPVLFDLSRSAAQTISELVHHASPKRVAVEFQPSSSVNVLADPDHINIVLRNLLSNAIKFSPIGETVTVETRMEHSWGVVSIKNLGVPIAPDAIAKILNGQRVSGTRGSSGEKGTGLGLAMCQEFIQSNRGRLDITSSRESGTVVRVFLPTE